MKSLISVAEIKKLVENQEKKIYVEANSIITPAAKDAAKEYGIDIVIGTVPKSDQEEKNYFCEEKKLDSKPYVSPSVDPVLIAKIVEEVITCLNISQQQSQAEKEIDPSGLRLVRGDSIVLENTNENIKKKEIFNANESPNMSAGFITIDNNSCSRELKCDEIIFLIEGNLDCTVNCRKYPGKAGDIFFFPANTKITISTMEKAKIFFVTYPANYTEFSGYKKL